MDEKHNTSSFPEPARSKVYEQLRAYAQFVINEEWRTMDEVTLEHEESTGALAAINSIWNIYRGLPPSQVDLKNRLTEIDKCINIGK